MPLTWVKDSN